MAATTSPRRRGLRANTSTSRGGEGLRRARCSEWRSQDHGRRVPNHARPRPAGVRHGRSSARRPLRRRPLGASLLVHQGLQRAHAPALHRRAASRRRGGGHGLHRRQGPRPFRARRIPRDPYGACVDGRKGYVWNHGGRDGYWYYSAWFPQPVHSVRVQCIATRQTSRVKMPLRRGDRIARVRLAIAERC
jgi:hypothetical protein